MTGKSSLVSLLAVKLLYVEMLKTAVCFESKDDAL